MMLTLSNIEIETLKKIFEDSPAKSTITFNIKCSDCGNDVLIDITPTSGGFGLKGGFLFERASDKYLVKCHNCYNLTRRHYN